MSLQVPKFVRAVILDGAGTLFDVKSIGPVLALSDTLLQHNYSGFTEADIRKDMGLPKSLHLAKLFQLPHLAAQFRNRHHRRFVYPYDVSLFYDDYKKLQLKVLKDDPECTRLVDTGLKLVEFLKTNKKLIGLVSGYDRVMMNVILPKLAEQGFEANITCSSTERGSRKEMIEYCLDSMHVRSPQAIACGDTVNDANGARDARVYGFSVSNAFTTNVELRAAGTNFCVERLSDIKAFIH